MQVVVVTNRRAPVVSHHVWYKVGSADSPVGKSGLAHFLEHLMFKGTDTLAPGEFSRIVARNGGNENAFTGQDYTGYFQTIARDRLETVMRMEADRMTHLKLDPEEVRTERDVVLEERSMRVDNDPGSRLGELVNATQFLNNPYRLPVIGWRHEMASYTPRGRARVLSDLVRAQQRGPDRRRRHRRRRAAAARREVLWRDPGAPGARAPPAGRAAAGRAARGRARRPARAPAVPDPLLSGAELHRRRDRARLSARGAGRDSGRHQHVPALSRAGDRAEGRDLGRRLLQRHRARSDHLPGLREPAPGRQPGRARGGGRRRAQRARGARRSPPPRSSARPAA